MVRHLAVCPAVLLVVLEAGDHCTHWVQQAGQAILWQQVQGNNNTLSPAALHTHRMQQQPSKPSECCA
jgi:hypothetical protein